MHRHVSQNNPFTITSHLRFVRNAMLLSPSWLYRLLFYNVLKMIAIWNNKNVSDEFDGVIYRWPTMFHFTYRTAIFFILNHTSSLWTHQFVRNENLAKDQSLKTEGFHAVLSPWNTLQRSETSTGPHLPLRNFSSLGLMYKGISKEKTTHRSDTTLVSHSPFWFNYWRTRQNWDLVNISYYVTDFFNVP